MKRLELPEQLGGAWEHVLVLTFGADVPFFEHALWPQFMASCKNKVILADGPQFLEACAQYAESGLVRYLNHRYVVEGIFAPHKAHAKLILLTNSEQGRLLIGSGNLNWQGYASGGELFSQYEYSAQSPSSLAAFLSVREFMEGLLSRGYVGDVASRHIRLLFESTPWLYHSATGANSPVRHNLSTSFLKQLEIETKGETIEEAWIHAPFLDRDAVALDRFLTVLHPRRATLLVQPGSTSLDPAALQKTLGKHKQLRVRSFRMRDFATYVHAKLFVLKLAKRAICLQGSPNLSVVAMLTTDPHSNIELANLLTDKRDAFDDLLSTLEIGPETTQTNNLELSYHSSPAPAETAPLIWTLTGGEWHSDQLSLSYKGVCPSLAQAALIIANRQLAFKITKQESTRLVLKLSSEAIELLKQPVPVSIRWGTDDEVTNPIFVCSRAALEQELQANSDEGHLHYIGGLELEDEEFEELLVTLEASLLIDRRSVWQLAGRPLPATPNEDNDEALRLEYAKVDYELLRKHPRIQQYLRKGMAGQASTRTRLQIILNAITDHFQGLLDVTEGQPAAPIQPGEAQTDDSQDEAESQEKDEAATRRRVSLQKRIRRLLKSFIRRYLRGFSSTDFQELAGFEVMAQNYVIFSHILWRLFAKDWVETDFIVDALLETWGKFWGNLDHQGYFANLTNEQKAQVLSLVHEYHADAEFLAAIYYCSRALKSWYLDNRDNEAFDDAKLPQEQRHKLRDAWRFFLSNPCFQVTTQMLEEVWRIVGGLFAYEPPRPTVILTEFRELAHYETRDGFLLAAEAQLHLSRRRLRFDRARVATAASSEAVSVECLVVTDPDILSDVDHAMLLLKTWMKAERLDYYRIVYPDANKSTRLIIYEPSQARGVFRKDNGEPITIRSIVLDRADWAEELDRIESLAQNLDQRLALPAKTAVKKKLSHGPQPA